MSRFFRSRNSQPTADFDFFVSITANAEIVLKVAYRVSCVLPK